MKSKLESFLLQVKATDNPPLLADGKTVSWAVSRRDLLLWMNEAFPVILVIYDGRRDRALWLPVQAYFADHPATDLFLAGATINVHVPVSNRLNRRSVHGIIQRKNATQARLEGRNANLRRVLLDLGFKEVPVTKPYIGFQHDESDLLIVQPSYRSNSLVAPNHLVYVRMMLDGKGLMAAAAFDRLVANVPTRHSAPG